MRNSLVECKGLQYQEEVVFFLSFSLTIIAVPDFLSKVDFSLFINSDQNETHIPKINQKGQTHVIFETLVKI